MTNLSINYCVDECPTLDKFCVLKNGTVINKSAKDCESDEHSIYYSSLITINDTLDIINRCIPNIPETLKNLESLFLF
jgi:hypothetical protein